MRSVDPAYDTLEEARDYESRTSWYSESQRKLVPMSEMHGAYLINAVKKLLRDAFIERREAEKLPADSAVGADARQLGLWAWTSTRSSVREDFDKLVSEGARRSEASPVDGDLVGLFRRYATQLDKGLSRG